MYERENGVQERQGTVYEELRKNCRWEREKTLDGRGRIVHESEIELCRRENFVRERKVYERENVV